MKRNGWLLAAVLAGGCASVESVIPQLLPPAERLARASVVVRDEWGVAHISAESEEAALFALGWAQADDANAGIVRNVARAAAAETSARAAYAAEPAEQRALWDAFALGINEWRAASGVRSDMFEPWHAFAIDAVAGPELAVSARVGTSVDGGTLFAARAVGSFEDGAVPWEGRVRGGGLDVRGAWVPGVPAPLAGWTGGSAWAADMSVHPSVRLDLSRPSWDAGAPPGVIVARQGAAPTASDGFEPVEAPDSGWIWAGWQESLYSTVLPDARPDIRAVGFEWETIGGTLPGRAFAVDEAIDLLRAWDGVVTAGSPAATVYLLWRDRLRYGGFTGEYAAFTALEDVVHRLRTDFDSVAVPWGEVNRLQRLPAIGAHNDALESRPLGAATAGSGATWFVESVYAPGTVRRYARSGVSWLFAVHLRDDVAASIVPFGASSVPGSAHFADQSEFYAGRLLKDASGTAESLVERGMNPRRPMTVRR